MKILLNIVSSVLYLLVIVFVIFFANNEAVDKISFDLPLILLLLFCCFCVSLLLDNMYHISKKIRRKVKRKNAKTNT